MDIFSGVGWRGTIELIVLMGITAVILGAFFFLIIKNVRSGVLRIWLSLIALIIIAATMFIVLLYTSASQVTL